MRVCVREKSTATDASMWPSLMCVFLCASSRVLQCVSCVAVCFVCCSVFHVLQCAAVCYRVLHYVAIGASACLCARKRLLQCVAVCCSVLQCVAVCSSMLQGIAVFCTRSVWVSVCTHMCVAVCWQCIAVCCSVLQCATVCYSVLQCVDGKKRPGSSQKGVHASNATPRGRIGTTLLDLSLRNCYDRYLYIHIRV